MSSRVDLPSVTIAIPTYNSAKRFLGETIASAVAQEYDNLEILVSDNASTDDTESVVRGFADPRLRYVRHKTSLGANGNFNFCLQEAKGDYMMLLHDDDLIDPDFISVCMELAAGSVSHSFIRTGIRVIDSSGAVEWTCDNIVDGRTPEALYRAWFDVKTMWYFCSTLFSTSAVREIGGFYSISNDLIDGYAIVKLAPRCDWLDVRDVKASVRKSPEQLTVSVPVEGWCQDYLGLLDLMCNQLVGDVDDFRALGWHTFGLRCRGRAEAQPTRVGRLKAGMTVAKYFGPRYFPWGRLGRIWTRIISK